MKNVSETVAEYYKIAGTLNSPPEIEQFIRDVVNTERRETAKSIVEFLRLSASKIDVSHGPITQFGRDTVLDCAKQIETMMVGPEPEYGKSLIEKSRPFAPEQGR